uniref:Nucleolar protein 16 n=1 Tax=Eutreptiella gymnastica TaxID=73025 RepID=A0A7S4GLX0_9EUGL|mmetsp:Transcript_58355/g.96724  ORF Transcript_58355/g.96724 Transcript_58355/m.96724 type:complete len:182 (+) Transcript_58355:45-590(+)|eukprot:CAMPEP_0174285782 /NCGR_PEP_ID=MMETSP0809-20121228/9714_1 /TAXON_ID=73025 ORGANISM="Eutreptiella gymnastica-like, Strain CCMP1594" /NCGR_SAMPLE_ID=MMETSP0809 /ASSEMBLY_ACC=CAM_ASM_000658 /LENGTH=181 /DNA_ID=CAMNT_0015381641 /DNA_START=45 /DNA_END=587 /DNA_ORIENTATION=-
MPGNSVRGRKTRKNKSINALGKQKVDTKVKTADRLTNKFLLNSEGGRKGKKHSLREKYARLGLSLESNSKLSKDAKYLKKLDEDDLDELPDPGKERPRLNLKLLGPSEQYFIQTMMNRYGTDYKAMSRDRRNVFQRTPAELKKKVAAYIRLKSGTQKWKDIDLNAPTPEEIAGVGESGDEW